MVDKKTDIKVQIEFYATEIAKERLDFTGLRKKLRSQYMDQNDIDHIVKRVDKRSVRIAELKGIHRSGKIKFFIGITLLFFGCVFPFIYNVVTLNRAVIAVYTFPFVLGLYLVWNGRNDMKRY